MRALVTHPGLQHAHQLAWALEEAGHLAAFWSGVPLKDSRCPGSGVWAHLGRGVRAVPVDSRRRRHEVIFPLFRRVIARCGTRRLHENWGHRLDRLYDAWVARRLTQLKPDVVIGYENSTLYTFRAAQAVGSICVLDAASVHFQAGRAWRSVDDAPDPEWVDQAKRAEIELADAILTCSPMAAATYVQAGIAADRVFAVPLGTALPEFGNEPRTRSGTVRFVFVGSLVRHKGIDELLDVLGEFAAGAVPACLTLIGGVGETSILKRLKTLPNVTLRAFMPQERLFREVAQHDCLVLPSRFDSFGMVVPEAMAVGVPAIVSERVGAKCIIEEHTDAGWVVPCDVAALKRKMLDLVTNRTALDRASHAARRAAQEYSWESYRRRVVRTLETLYARHRMPEVS